MKWIDTRQERLHGWLIQFEVYQQAGKTKPYTALAYHGPLLVARASAKTASTARDECRRVFLEREQKLNTPRP